MKPIPGTISKKSFGKEGFVVLAVPVKAVRHRPDLSFLAQTGLTREEAVPRAVRLKGAETKVQTPFERLLAATAFGKVGTRSFEPDEPTNPTTFMWSWVTVPPGKRP